MPNWLSEWFSDAKSQATDHVLLAGDEEKCCVLAAGWIVVLNSRRLYADNVFFLAELPLRLDEGEYLEEELDGGGAEHADKDRRTEQRLLRQMLRQLVVCSRPRLKDAERHEHTDIDVQELVVRQVALGNVEHRNGDELDDGVELDELECLERSRQGSSALPQERNHTGNVLHFAGERSSYGRLGLREADAGIGLLKGATIVGSIATHADLNLHGLLEQIHQIGLVLWRHSRVHLRLAQYLVQGDAVLIPVTTQEVQEFAVECHAKVVGACLIPGHVSVRIGNVEDHLFLNIGEVFVRIAFDHVGLLILLNQEFRVLPNDLVIFAQVTKEDGLPIFQNIARTAN